MSKDKIGLLVSVGGFVVSTVSAIYKQPILAVFIAGVLIVAYLGYLVYVMHKNIPGDTWVRLGPAVFLIVTSGVIFWFWPATLNVVLYEDANQDGRRDEKETALTQEPVAVFDSKDVRYEKTTSEKGNFSISLPPGDVRLRIRGYYVLRDLKRGENLIQIGFVPPKGTRPEFTFYLSNEPFFQSRGAVETVSRKVYAHLYFADKERPVRKVEIDWGDGNGPKDLNLTTSSNLKYYLLTHEYESAGPKIVRIRLTNSAGVNSDPPPGEPEAPGKNFDTITIRNPDTIKIRNQ